ncbi:MAG: hypothetical protein PF517_21875 [Salinivirgaceae bacterium]|jgi:hypothetical protein|nr:hypothetical protein [Salinivirgaceae bacterium]
MKIKNLLFVMTFAGLGFVSCDLEDIATTEVSSDIEVDMPLAGETNKSADDSIPFSGSGKVNLADIAEFKNNIDNLKGFRVKDSSSFTVKDLPDTLSVYSVKLSVQVGTNGIVNLSEYKSVAGFANDSIVVLKALDITNINAALGAWEGSNYTDTVYFTASGSANQDMNKYDKSDIKPKVKLLLKSIAEVGL